MLDGSHKLVNKAASVKEDKQTNKQTKTKKNPNKQTNNQTEEKVKKH